jgi:hypothetical protein
MGRSSCRNEEVGLALRLKWESGEFDNFLAPGRNLFKV